MTFGWRLRDPLQMDALLALANPIALQTSTANVIAQRRPDMPDLICFQFELASGYWQTYTRSDVTGLGVGLGEKARQVDFSFDDAPHTLVAGETKCGKSVAVASILVGLCETYTPDELRLVVIDPDRDYDMLTNVANLALPIANERAEIDNALAWVSQELTRRKGQNIKDAERLLVVIDEAETTLGDEQRLAMAQAIARGGRKFNVNLLIATQKPKQTTLPDLINQLGNRFIGKTDNAQTSALLTGHAGLQTHKLTRGGDFLHINGSIQRFQVAMATRQDFERLERAEVTWRSAEFVPEDVPLPARDEGGRPATEIEPRKVAWYVHYGPDNISINQAEEYLGLKRRGHDRHKNFALELMDELERLRKQLRNES